MPVFLDSSQAQCDQHPSTNIDSQQLSPPLSLSRNDSPSKTNELFGDEPDPSCLVSTSPRRNRVVTHQCSPKVPVNQDSRIILASCSMPSVDHDLPSDDLRHVIKVSRRNDRIVVSSQSPPPPSSPSCHPPLPPSSPECIVIDDVVTSEYYDARANCEEALRVFRSVFEDAEALARSPASPSSPNSACADLV